MGSVVEMKDPSGEKRRAVVFKYYLDKGSVTVIDVKSRKRKTVRNSSHLVSYQTLRFDEKNLYSLTGQGAPFRRILFSK